MSKDCKRSYEEVHKKLGEELEKAYLKREAPRGEDSGIRSVISGGTAI